MSGHMFVWSAAAITKNDLSPCFIHKMDMSYYRTILDGGAIYESCSNSCVAYDPWTGVRYRLESPTDLSKPYDSIVFRTMGTGPASQTFRAPHGGYYAFRRTDLRMVFILSAKYDDKTDTLYMVDYPSFLPFSLK